MSARLLPLTGWIPSPWGWGCLLAPGLLIPLVVLIIVPHEWFAAFITAFYLGPYTTVPGLVFGVLWLRERFRRARRAELARCLGMTFQPRLSEDDVDPFLDLPLFRFTENGTYSAAYRMRGWFDGREVLVFDFGFQGRFSKRVHVKVPGQGLQTVGLLAVEQSLPDFHLAPEVNDWDDLDPLWWQTLRLGPVLLECGSSRRDPNVIRGRDREAIARHFSSPRLEQLGNLRGWTIECRDGWLLIYRFREVLPVEELPAFVRRVVDLAAVLTAPEEEGGRPPAPFADPPASQEDRLTTLGRPPDFKREDSSAEGPGSS